MLTTIPPRGLPLPVARDFFFQLCSALAYCHGNKVSPLFLFPPLFFSFSHFLSSSFLVSNKNLPQQIIHGDMKPENVLVRLDNRIKVIDFGFSHVVDGNPLTVCCLFPFYPSFLSRFCIYLSLGYGWNTSLFSSL